MPKPGPQLAESVVKTESDPQQTSSALTQISPLAELVSEHLRAKGLRQIDFCRQTGFDQGLLSKILSSVVNTLNVESALKLASGLGLPPAVIFEAIGKKEVDEMLRRFYAQTPPGERVM